MRDRHVKPSSGNSAVDREPEVDPSQDYQLLLGYENNTHTVLRFRRKLDTCDRHDIPITNDTMRVLWAHHPKEPIGGAVGPGSLPQHEAQHRGSRPLFLLQRAEVRLPDEAVKVWEAKSGEVKPGAQGEGIYWCQYEPLLSPKQVSTSGLQYIVMYECLDSPFLASLAAGSGRHCHEPHSQPISCNTVVASWTRGSEDITFWKPTTSLPWMGALQYQEPVYAFTTPKNYVDMTQASSPLEWTLTGGTSFLLVNRPWCPAAIAFQSAPDSVSSSRDQHVRYGHEDAQDWKKGSAEAYPKWRGTTSHSCDDNLDSDYQEYRKIETPVRVLPGDHLITQCTYNSSARRAITLGGLSNERRRRLQSSTDSSSSRIGRHDAGIKAGVLDWDNQFDSFQEATLKGSFKPLCWTSQSTLLPVSSTATARQSLKKTL
nr:unnamed protein product [Callosobruchus chinensis]